MVARHVVAALACWLLVCARATTLGPPGQKLVAGGFGSGGVWQESGNRLPVAR